MSAIDAAEVATDLHRRRDDLIRQLAEVTAEIEAFGGSVHARPWRCTADTEHDGRCVGPNVDPAHQACPGRGEA